MQDDFEERDPAEATVPVHAAEDLADVGLHALDRDEPPVPRLVGEVELVDGRSLAWAEYGHPDGDPVLWFHGTPGGRHQVPPAVDEVALRSGFRVIAVERPGTGSSTDHRYGRVAEFAPDVEALVDALGVDRFAVVGLSGGGPYTLAVADRLPDRVVVATLLGGFGPVRGPDAVHSYTRVFRFLAPGLEVLRGPLGGVFSSFVRVADPIAAPAFSVYANLFGFADRGILRRAGMRAMFLHDLLTADDVRAAAHDLALFTRHWGFNLTGIRPPVVVWQGLSDVIVPPSHGHHQAARVPRGELHVRPGEGHFAGFAEVDSVLGRVREVWAGETAAPVGSTRDD